jgi:two-component system response regulator
MEAGYAVHRRCGGIVKENPILQPATFAILTIPNTISTKLAICSNPRNNLAAMDLLGPILLVEDNDDDAFFFQKAVQRVGVSIQVDRVVDGSEAVNYLMRQIELCGGGSATKPLLVLLDLKLPKMNGFEVLEWIRSHAALKHLFVSILSSSGEEKDRLRASYLKADAYLVKPVSIQDYYQLVRQLVEEWLVPRLPAEAAQEVLAKAKFQPDVPRA